MLTDLITKAKIENRSIYLQVLRNYEKARKLYENLEFSIESTSDTHIEMVYKK